MIQFNCTMNNPNQARQIFVKENVTLGAIPHHGAITLVITAEKEFIDKNILNLSEAKRKELLQKWVGTRYANLENVSEEYKMIPLTMEITKQQDNNKGILLGTSALSMWPIAAQGLNLSVSDVKEIEKFIISAPYQSSIIQFNQNRRKVHEKYYSNILSIGAGIANKYMNNNLSSFTLPLVPNHIWNEIIKLGTKTA